MHTLFNIYLIVFAAGWLLIFKEISENLSDLLKSNSRTTSRKTDQKHESRRAIDHVSISN